MEHTLEVFYRDESSPASTSFPSKEQVSQLHSCSQCLQWLWTIKKAKCWRTDDWRIEGLVLEKPLESPLDWKEIKPVNSKGNQPWIFLGKTDAEAEVLWPPDMKSQLIGKDPDAGKDWRQKEKGTTEDKLVGWHHWLNGHEFEKALWDGEGQGSLVWYSPRSHKKSDMI